MTLDAEQFLKDLAEQRRLYEKMTEGAEEQNRVIASADMDALLGILKKKTALLQEIEEIEKRTAPMREAWKTERGSLDAETVRRVEEAVRETQEVLKKLLALEEQGRSMMQGQKGDTGDKLKDIQQKKRMLDAYGKSSPPESRFYDKSQ
ncbi:MAG: flagellar export chaperone FlgN [Planctomycetota bacterium]|jgi:polyribonucleotide nucleotidyltransferase